MPAKTNNGKDSSSATKNSNNQSKKKTPEVEASNKKAEKKDSTKAEKMQRNYDIEPGIKNKQEGNENKYN